MSLQMPHLPQHAYAGLQSLSASLDCSRAREDLAADLLSACAGSDPTRYAVAFSPYLASPDTKSAEAWAPLRWRYRSSGSVDATDAATQVRPALCLPCFPRASPVLPYAVLLPTTQEIAWRSPCRDYDINAYAHIYMSAGSDISILCTIIGQLLMGTLSILLWCLHKMCMNAGDDRSFLCA